MAYKTSENYETILYSGDSRHDLKIWFNNIELQNAKNYCEKITKKSRIQNNIDNVFSLSNFIAEEVTIIFHDIDLSIIKDQIRISIGTLVDNEFEYVPIGIFNLQEKPTTNKDKTTLKLRDNAIKFDFYYNALPLIEQNGGTATKMQILKDICNQANVVCNIENFINSDEQIGIYDNTIQGRTYISYLAEQSGAIARINRDGELIFIYLNNLETKVLPRNILSSYEVGERYKISRVVYESGIIKYEYPTEEEMDEGNTLYLNSANPYISSQEQVELIYNLVKDFEIYSLKIGKMFGNPSLDPFDIIEITDNGKTYKTFASNSLEYSTGTIIANYETTLSLSKIDENVSKKGLPNFMKYAKTLIDNVEGKVEIITGSVNEITGDINSVKTTQDNQSLQIDILTTKTDKIDEEGNATSFQTSNGYKLDNSGLHMFNSEDNFNATYTNQGTYYKDGNDILQQTTKDGTKTKDIELYGVFKYGKETIDDEPMFIAQMYTNDSGEVGFGHFYNRGDE